MTAKITLHKVTSPPTRWTIVNAANNSLLAAGASTAPSTAPPPRAAGGMPHTGRLRDRRREDHQGLPTAAAHVIHTVGPVYRDGTHGEPELLASAYRRSVEVASANGCARMAFPAISAGVYGYPLDEVAKIALTTVDAALADHPEVVEARFWLFNDQVLGAFERALAEIGRHAHSASYQPG